MKVLPHTIETKREVPPQSNKFLEEMKQHNIASRKPFVFLVEFDSSDFVSSDPRVTIQLFLDAFPKNEDAAGSYQLILYSPNGSASSIDSDLEKIAKTDGRIVFLTDELTAVDKQALYSYQDCHLSLHRKNGNDVNILESLQNGIPVIATDHGGHLDFFQTLTDYQGSCIFSVPIEIQGSVVSGQDKWAIPDHEFVVASMRRVTQNNCKTGRGNDISTKVGSQFGNEKFRSKLEDLMGLSLEVAMLHDERMRNTLKR